jgi:RNA polymerase sigma-70 factor (ECF subfamily)
MQRQEPQSNERGSTADVARAQPDAAGQESPAGEPSDHALLRGAQQGDGAAFEVLVRRHQARALRVARNLVADADEAQDLAQEAFLRVFRSLERFDFQHEFSTWLYRIVTNLAIDHLRRRRRHLSTAAGADEDAPELDLVDDSVPAPERRMDAAETALRVRACIASLAPHFQSVLVLRELEGLACTEIADIVGATHVTVRWRLHRGRKLFQEEWERRERIAAAGLHQRANEPKPFDVEDPEGNDSDR